MLFFFKIIILFFFFEFVDVVERSWLKLLLNLIIDHLRLAFIFFNLFKISFNLFSKQSSIHVIMAFADLMFWCESDSSILFNHSFKSLRKSKWNDSIDCSMSDKAISTLDFEYSFLVFKSIQDKVHDPFETTNDVVNSSVWTLENQCFDLSITSKVASRTCT